MAHGHRIPTKQLSTIPKIDGSQAGFIALVVFLSVLIVVCCSAVFYLLRYHEPTDQDRTARRERYRRRRAEVDGSTVETPFGEKFKQAWNRVRHGKRRGRGDQALSHEGQVQSLPKNDIEYIPRTVESSLSGTGDAFLSPLVSRSMDMSDSDVIRAQSPLSESTCKEDESDEEQATRDSRHFSTLSTGSGTRFIEHV
ncbi:hypothetical protein SCLCIDRAFT_1052172 [Scleroderma citrinum Foug A]|uniref:Uncharacterized protein n=1 Tax=Scleroderma citrinum Foug A TaxID=1036808 RepID=A0A0C2ZAK7_9AGAM|nr:hypothetical protein SCLCIDRAFT_1052172 [Scleroderma citrinum Foug A]